MLCNTVLPDRLADKIEPCHIRIKRGLKILGTGAGHSQG